MSDERVLVTGGTGCIGSWVVRNLVREEVTVVALTAARRFARLKLILTDAEFGRINFVTADISDMATIEAAARRHGINRIIHLAGMQLPFCAADPIRGAQVNVGGTVTIFELAKRLGVERVVYASSAAVYGPRTHYQEATLGPGAAFFPTSHYGVYKVANEQSARIFWQTDGIASIGLRPHSVYGPGRDQGMTSKPTLAMIAAAAGRPYHIPFNGRYQFQFADDAARAFLRAARAPLQGATVFDIGGSTVGVDAIVTCIEAHAPEARGRITFGDQPLLLPEAFDSRPILESLGSAAETPLDEGVLRTLDCYRAALREGTLDAAYLDRVLA
ncbi:MAG: NAD(P)-dependent oxidoreductase [Candidatus Limnocylindrales bacterium]|nr:NAD(P)-dependent oxidoreductase [Candidatus Limnocylindrales bacterium]